MNYKSSDRKNNSINNLIKKTLLVFIIGVVANIIGKKSIIKTFYK